MQYASEELRGDREVVLAAVKSNGNQLEYASEALRGDREIVLAAVKFNGDQLEYASEELRGDKEIVLAAVQHSGSYGALQYASEELRGDREVVLAAVKNDMYALQYASEELQNDEELKKIAERTRAEAMGIKINEEENSEFEQENRSLDDMSLEELLEVESKTDTEIEQTDAEIERLTVLRRVKGKIEIAKQKKAELDALRGQAEMEVGEGEKSEKDTHEEEQL